MDAADQFQSPSLREKVSYGLIGALGKMADKLADRHRAKAVDAMSKVRDMDISDVRRVRAEQRAAKHADDAIKLDRAAEQARDFVNAWTVRR